MVRGYPWVGALLGAALVACSGVTPKEQSAEEQAGIIGGQNDTTHRGVFGIIINNQSLCSASLIAPNLLLTAHHCVSDISTGADNINCQSSTFGTPFAASSFVASWAPDLSGNVQPSSVFDVNKVYVPTNNLVCGDDIALLRLSANVASTAAATITPRVDSPPADNEAYTAVGYGITDPNDTQGNTALVRRSATGLTVGCVGASECASAGAKTGEWGGYTATCGGDSGGPALDAQGQVIGVTSRGDATCLVGLYSSVSSWKSLIVDAATDAANAGGYPPPDWAGGTTMPPDGGVAGGPSAGTGGTGGTGGAGSGGKSGAGTGGTVAMAGRGGATGSGGSAGRSASGGQASGGQASGGQASGGKSGGSAGMSTTIPVTDAGAPPPDASAPGNDGGGLVKPGPMLGESCTDSCFGSLLCYSASGKPPGTCVPPCTSIDKTCPAQYDCNAHIGACIPIAGGSSSGGSSGSSGSSSDSTKTNAGCGCRVNGESSGSSWQALGLLALCGGMLRRRRRATVPRTSQLG
jgi:MYXO-CTERM domain-containing protein